MKTLFTVYIIFFIANISLAAEQAAWVYDGAVLTEDVTWRGSVLVKKFVVIAPQATLRIEPGTVVRFAATAAGQLPNMVVQGRIHAAGTSERPILLTTEQSGSVRGTWGGVVLLTTEKRNLLEQCRIENVDTGIDLRFSSITLKSVSITRARTALLSNDSVVQITGCDISDSEAAVRIYNSEFEAKDMSVSACQQGCLLRKSAVILTSSKITKIRNTGLDADECRIRITDGDISENTLGARIRKSEGQISQSRFQRNDKTALHLIDSPIKVQRCLFAENKQEALRTEDGRVLLQNNIFTSNDGFNIVNTGSENVSARLNWWGTTDKLLIGQKIHDSSRDKNIGEVQVSPWLREAPLLVLQP